MFPSLAADMSHSFSWGKSLNLSEYKWEDSGKQNGYIRAYTEFVLFNGLSVFYNCKEKKYIESRERLNLKKLKYDIGAEVMKNYFELCIAKERIKIYDGFISNTEDRLKKIKILEECGKLSKLDVLEVKAQLEKYKEESGNANNVFKDAVHQLKISMNWSAGKSLVVSEKLALLGNKDYNQDSVYRNILEVIPDIYMLKEDSLIFKSKINKTRSFYFPKLSLQAEIYSRYQKDMQDPLNSSINYKYSSQLKDNLYKQISLNLSIPIYSRNKVKGEILKIRLEEDKLRLRKQLFYNNLYLNIENICSKIKQLRANYLALNKQQKYYDDLLRIRNVQYENGRLSIVDLLTIVKERNKTIINKNIQLFNLRYMESLIEYYMEGIN